MLRSAAVKVEVEYPYLYRDQGRHGNVRYYFRRNYKKTRIRERPGTLEFQAAYDALLAASDSAECVQLVGTPIVGTYRWLCEQYLRPTSSSPIQRPVRGWSTRGLNQSLRA